MLVARTSRALLWLILGSIWVDIALNTTGSLAEAAVALAAVAFVFAIATLSVIFWREVVREVADIGGGA